VREANGEASGSGQRAMRASSNALCQEAGEGVPALCVLRGLLRLQNTEPAGCDLNPTIVMLLLTESKVPEGRTQRTALQYQLQMNIANSTDILCTLSADDFALFVTPLLINVKHISSCLQRTMIRRWQHGFQDSNLEEEYAPVAILSGVHALTRWELLQQEKTRPKFIKEYRAAYALVCQAAESLDALFQMHSSTWDEHTPQERQMSVAAFQQGLNDYCSVVSDAVLGHLPGQTFLKLYSQEGTL